MTLASCSLIHGLSLGIEHVDAIPEEEIPNSIVLDLFFVRFVISMDD